MIKRIRCHLSMALTQLGWAIVLFALHTSSPVLLFYLNGIVARVEDGRWYTFDEICTFDCPECIARELLCIVSWDADIPRSRPVSAGDRDRTPETPSARRRRSCRASR